MGQNTKKNRTLLSQIETKNSNVIELQVPRRDNMQRIKDRLANRGSDEEITESQISILGDPAQKRLENQYQSVQDNDNASCEDVSD